MRKLNYRKKSIRKYYEAIGIEYGKLYKTKMRKLEKSILILNLKKSQRILDIGCGDGYHFYTICKYGKIYGLDISKTLLKEFRNKAPCILGDVEKLPIKDSSIDAAVSIFGALNHCNIDQALKEIRRVLKERGILIVTVANKLNIIYILNNIIKLRFRKVLKSIIKGEGFIYRFISNKRYKVWTKFYSLFELIKHLKRNGFVIIKIYGLNRNGFIQEGLLSIFSEYIGIICTPSKLRY